MISRSMVTHRPTIGLSKSKQWIIVKSITITENSRTLSDEQHSLLDYMSEVSHPPNRLVHYEDDGCEDCLVDEQNSIP